LLEVVAAVDLLLVVEVVVDFLQAQHIQ